MTGQGRIASASIALALTVSMASSDSLAVEREASCSRVVAVGDLHGAYADFRALLVQTGLVDAQMRWKDPEACLVQLGDVVDRGPRSRELLELLIALQQAAPQRVFPLLGNHEVMNILGDLRYVAPEEFAAFAHEETGQERERAFREYSADPRVRDMPEPERRALFGQEHPPGWFAHRRSFAPDGRYGRWLLQRPIVLRIHDTVYAHGGLAQQDAETGLARLNERVGRDARRFLSLRRQLERRGVISRLASFVELLGSVQLWLQRDRALSPELQDAATARLAVELLRLTESPIQRLDGPLWNRDAALAEEQAYAPLLRDALRAVQASRLVVAHTPTEDRRIHTRFNGRVFLIDTGAGPAYSGEASALEISRGGEIRAIYRTATEVLVAAPPSDAQMEQALEHATVLESKLIGSGITRPKKLLLEWEGRTFSAAFKDVDVQETNLTRFSTSAGFNFTDRFHYERTAYLLDRWLGMGMVPVVVLRTIEGTEGALIAWVSDTINESERQQGNLGPDDPLLLVRQRQVMRVFDALILNTDRNLANQLYTADWKLHLIDHSRSFRVQRRLPEGFTDAPIGLPRALFERLRALDLRTLEARMQGLLSKAQIKAVLARRDAIVAKVDADRKSYGDAFVFHDGAPSRKSTARVEAP